MKSSHTGSITILIFLLMCLSSCEAIAGIFKAGVWTGVIIVGLVIAFIVFIILRSSKKS